MPFDPASRKKSIHITITMVKTGWFPQPWVTCSNMKHEDRIGRLSSDKYNLPLLGFNSSRRKAYYLHLRNELNGELTSLTISWEVSRILPRSDATKQLLTISTDPACLSAQHANATHAPALLKNRSDQLTLVSHQHSVDHHLLRQ